MARRNVEMVFGSQPKSIVKESQIQEGLKSQNKKLQDDYNSTSKELDSLLTQVLTVRSELGQGSEAKNKLEGHLFVINGGIQTASQQLMGLQMKIVEMQNTMSHLATEISNKSFEFTIVQKNLDIAKDDATKKLVSLENEYRLHQEAITSQISVLSNKLSHIENEIKMAEEKFPEVEKSIVDKMSKLEKLDEDIEARSQRIKILESSIATLNLQLNETIVKRNEAQVELKGLDIDKVKKQVEIQEKTKTLVNIIKREDALGIKEKRLKDVSDKVGVDMNTI